MAVERTVAPIPSLERLERINSIYLQRDRGHLGYGLFIANDRLIGVRASHWYWLISIIHAPILVLASVAGFLVLGFGGEFALLVLVLSFVDLVLVSLNSIIVFPILEKVVRRKDFSIDELEEKRDLDVRKSDVWEVEVRQPKALSSGLLEFRLRSHATLRIRMNWTRQGDMRFAEMFRLVESFTGRQPVYNYAGWAVLRLN